MKHEKALAIRTLTEAMMNANNLADSELEIKLRDQIFSMITPQAPETPFVVKDEQVYVKEAAVAEPNKTIEQLVTEAIGDQCACCIISGLLISGEPFPYGAEEFMYGYAKIVGAQEMRATLQAVAVTMEKAIQDGRLEATKEFAHRYAEFTLATTRVRARLADEGLLAPLTDAQKFIAELMEADIKRRLASL